MKPNKSPMPDAETTATLTFLFSDIEGSTPLWEAQPDAMSGALARHDALVRQAIEDAGGEIFKTVGDAFHAAFHSPGDAFQAAVSAQTALAAASWGLDNSGALRVRLALHTGPAERRDGDYFGAALSRTARLLAAAHGGQTLLSDTAAKLAPDALPPGVSLRFLGQHALKGFTQASEIWELSAPGLPAGFPPLRLPDLFPHNLPAALTSFIGRDAERAAAREKLAAARLVTLVGTGGTGKTRLALQLAADVREDYPGGTWLVEMAALSDPELIEQEIAGVLGLREDAGRLRQTLLEALRPQPLLLILDNCEHLIDAVARLTEALLKSCPKLSVLATSREALGIGGEAVLPLPPLGLPPPGDARTLEALGGCDSVRLFVERATAALPQFRLSSGNAAAVASVCTRLDGIPLALELAAARVKVLTPEQIDGRLNDRFRLLTGGSRTALPRQQTLRALVDWSYELLSPAEQCLLRRLSVFHGDWSLGAAEAVCAGGEVEDWEVLEGLSHLAAKSLIVVETPDGGPVRYRLLQSIHSYTAGKLAESPDERDGLRRKHRDFFVSLAEEAEPNLLGASQVLWLNTLECDMENLRAALAFAQEIRDGTLPRLAGALSRFWYGRSYLSEGRSRLEAALAEISSEDAVLGKVLSGAGMLAWCCGDYDTARAYHLRDLALQQRCENPHGIARALGNLCIVAEGQKQYAEAERYGQESLGQYRGLGDRANSARMLNSMGVLALGQGDYAGAEDLYRRALAEYRELYDAAGSAATLHNLGDLLFQQGQYAQAKPYFRDSLEAQRTLRSKQQTATTLTQLAEIAGVEGRHAEVCILQAASEAAREGEMVTLGLGFDPWATLAQSRAALGEEQFALFWAQGARIDASQSIQYVLDNYDGLT